MLASPDTSVQINACTGGGLATKLAGFRAKWNVGPLLTGRGRGVLLSWGGGHGSAQVDGGSRYVDECAREFPRPC